MDYFVRFWNFAGAFSSEYFAWVGAVMFGLDQLLSRNFWKKEQIAQLDERWPEENRHHLFRWLAIIGFVVASFQAFDQVNSKLKEQQQMNTALLSSVKSQQ